VITQYCYHTLITLQQHDNTNHRDNIAKHDLLWDYLEYKCDTWDRPLDERDDTCSTVLTTLCESATGVHIAKTSQTHKDKPSK